MPETNGGAAPPPADPFSEPALGVLCRLAARAVRRRDRLTLAHLALALACVAYAALLPAHRSVAKLALSRSHMRVPYLVWAGLQVVPAMYSFENRWRVEAVPANRNDHSVLSAQWINHHPTRALFEPERRIALYGSCVDYEFTSTYRDQSMSTRFRVCYDTKTNQLTVERTGS